MPELAAQSSWDNPTRFMQCVQGPSGLGSAMFFFYTNHLGFQPTFIGLLQLLEGAARLAGAVLELVVVPSLSA